MEQCSAMLCKAVCVLTTLVRWDGASELPCGVLRGMLPSKYAGSLKICTGGRHQHHALCPLQMPRNSCTAPGTFDEPTKPVTEHARHTDHKLHGQMTAGC